MIINLYHNKSDEKQVSKDITLIEARNGSFKGPTDILAPVIRLDGIDLSNAPNYAYIEELGRYYFITGITAITDRVAEISMRVDVLMTYKDKIYDINAIIDRQENIYNLYMQDDEIPLIAEKKIQYKKFPRSMNINPTYVMVISGKGE